MIEAKAEMPTDNYQLGLDKRRELLSVESFSRNEYRVWTHADGRAIGEGVILALIDSAFLRYLGLGEVQEKSQSTGA